jgi:hypothetical protein
LDILAVFIDTITEDLLALLVDIVDVIHDDGLLFPMDARLRLAKCLEFVAEKLDALFFQIVDGHDVVFGEDGGFREAVVFANNGVDDGGFAGTRISHKEYIQVVDVVEGFEHEMILRVEVEVADKIGAIFVDECVCHRVEGGSFLSVFA